MAVAIIDGHPDGSKSDHFAFFTAGKNYHLRADTVAETNDWVHDLKEVIDKCNEEVGETVKEAEKKRHSMMPRIPHAMPVPEVINEKQKTYGTPGASLAVPKQGLLPPSGGFELIPGSVSTANYSMYSGTEDLGHSSVPSDYSCPLTEGNAGAVSEDEPATTNTPAPPIRNVSNSSALSSTLPAAGASTATNEPVLQSGYLYRLKKRYHHWVKQYAILTASGLSFYKSDSALHLAGPPVKVIPISRLVDVVEQDAASKTKEWCMLLITGEKHMKFSCGSEEKLIQWLAAIKLLLDKSGGLQIGDDEQVLME